ncbi:MAG: LptF/LptG family permease [Planctomycetota bacterium]|jgi:lipopolysaccharide export LptBFGC system permease protein LptF
MIGRTLFRYVAAELLRVLLVALAWLMLLGLLVVFLRARFTSAGRLLGARECLAGLLVVIPYLFGFLLPAAVLAAVISTFGRLASDNELTAMRAAGLSPVAVAAAPLALGLLASLVLLWLNVEGYRYAAKALAHVESGFEFSEERLARPGTSLEVEHERGKIIFTFLPRRDDGSQPVRLAQIDRDGDSYQFVARRFDCSIYLRQSARGKRRRMVDFDLYNVQAVDPHRRMRASLPENLEEIRYQQSRVARALVRYEAVRAEARRRLILSACGGDVQQALESVGSGSRHDVLLKYLRYWIDNIAKLRAEISRKIAFSFSPLIFALVGIGLGAMARRSSKLVGLSLGVLVCALYYGAWVVGKAAALEGLIPPLFAPWIPNVLGAIAGVLLVRGRKGT